MNVPMISKLPDVAFSTIECYYNNPIAKWIGASECVCISQELIEGADPYHLRIEGNTVYVRQFTLVLTAYYPYGGGLYIARRIAPPMEAHAPTTIEEIKF
jgi:hypothetical protein